ncbi:hydroxyacylglutathione hydrolase [Colwellia sp. MEBiC06753]
MTINITPINAFNDNYIWAITANNNSALTLVDPGQAQPCINFIKQHNLSLSYILVTHHHPDHVGAIAELIDLFPQATVFGPANENIPHKAVALKEGDTVPLPEFEVEYTVLDVPGHTAGHIVYFNDEVLFCGDTLFSGGCGRLFEGTPAQMHNSLAKLKSLPAHTKVYCAHEYTLSNLAFAQAVEPNNRALDSYSQHVQGLRAENLPSIPTTIEQEIAINPFLRCNQYSIKSSAEIFAGNQLTTEVNVFATIRKWKDQF